MASVQPQHRNNAPAQPHLPSAARKSLPGVDRPGSNEKLVLPNSRLRNGRRGRPAGRGQVSHRHRSPLAPDAPLEDAQERCHPHIAGRRLPGAPIGEYQEISEPGKLVYTWSWEDGSLTGTLVTVEFRDLGSATELVLTHERFPTTEWRDKTRRGLDRLPRPA